MIIQPNDKTYARNLDIDSEYLGKGQGIAKRFAREETLNGRADR